jgi:hypothetical protein
MGKTIILSKKIKCLDCNRFLRGNRCPRCRRAFYIRSDINGSLWIWNERSRRWEKP